MLCVPSRAVRPAEVPADKPARAWWQRALLRKEQESGGGSAVHGPFGDESSITFSEIKAMVHALNETARGGRRHANLMSVLCLRQCAVHEQAIAGNLLRRWLHLHVLAAKKLGYLLIGVGHGHHRLHRTDSLCESLLPLCNLGVYRLRMVADPVAGLHGKDQRVGHTGGDRLVDRVIGIAEAGHSSGEAVELWALAERARGPMNADLHRLADRSLGNGDDRGK